MYKRFLIQGIQSLLWTSFGKIITVLSMIWIMRCMGPENYGISGLVYTIIGIVSLAVNFGFDIFGVRLILNNRNESKYIIEVITGFRVKMCLFLSILFILVIMLANHNAVYTFSLFMGIPLLIVTGLNTTWVLQGLEKYQHQCKIDAIIACITAAISLLIIRPGACAGIDIAVFSLASTIGILIAWKYIKDNTYATIKNSLMKSFPLHLLWEVRWCLGIIITWTVNLNFDMLIIASYLPASQLGIYRSAQSLLTAVSILIVTVNSIIYPYYLKWRLEGEHHLLRRQLTIAKHILYFSITSTIIILLTGKNVLIYILGIEYREVFTPFVFLYISRMLILIAGVFGWAVLSRDLDKQYFIVCLITAATSIFCNILLIDRFGIIGASYTSVIVETIMLAGMLYLSIFQRNIHVRKEYS